MSIRKIFIPETTVHHVEKAHIRTYELYPEDEDSFWALEVVVEDLDNKRTTVFKLYFNDKPNVIFEQ